MQDIFVGDRMEVFYLNIQRKTIVHKDIFEWFCLNTLLLLLHADLVKQSKVFWNKYTSAMKSTWKHSGFFRQPGMNVFHQRFYMGAEIKIKNTHMKSTWKTFRFFSPTRHECFSSKIPYGKRKTNKKHTYEIDMKNFQAFFTNQGWMFFIKDSIWPKKK
jgi:hypothetical protein